MFFHDSGITRAHVCFHMHHEKKDVQSTSVHEGTGWCFAAHALMIFKVATLPITNIALENQWLEDDISLWDGLSSGATLVFGGVLL